MPETKFEYIAIENLREYERNTRTHSDEQIEQLKRSIVEYGFTNPVLVDENNVLIAGHGRTRAARLLGMSEVPAIRVSGLSKAQCNALRIADNQLALNAGWDEELLKIELEELKAEDYDLDLTGFSDDELKIYFDEHTDTKKEIIEDEIPCESSVQKRCEKGDIWELGKHRLMCGDSTNRDDVARLMGGQKADVAFTSPPYGMGDNAKIRQHYTKGQSNLDSLYDEYKDDATSWHNLFSKSLENMMEHTFTQFVNVQMLGNNKRDLIKIVSEKVHNLVDIIVWDKCKAPPQMQSNVLNNRFEFVFIFGEKDSSRIIKYGDFHGTVQNLLVIQTGINEYAEKHKAVFPVALPSAILEINAKAKSVLDLFGGTGTTLIAAEQLGRKCYMMELSEQYCDIIIERWEKLTGETAKKIK